MKRDEMFSDHHPHRFRSHTKRTEGSSIMVDGSLVTNLYDVLANWANHFTTLGQSRCSDDPLLGEYVSHISDIEARSFSEGDFILDSPIVVEEVNGAIHHLKRDSAGGPDLLTPNHLKHSGPLVRKWLCRTFNHLLDFEAIPLPVQIGHYHPSLQREGNRSTANEQLQGSLSDFSFGQGV